MAEPYGYYNLIQEIFIKFTLIALDLVAGIDLSAIKIYLKSDGRQKDFEASSSLLPQSHKREEGNTQKPKKIQYRNDQKLSSREKRKNRNV